MLNYYTKAQGNNEQSVYDLWERGGIIADSITPSTHCPHYQQHMYLKLKMAIGEDGKLFSAGCGNAFIEARISKDDLHVKAIDLNADAVRLAQQKGVNASIEDFFEIPDGSLNDFNVFYADGFIGHLFSEENGLDAFISKVQRLGMKPNSWVILSNDPPRSLNVPYEKHEAVPGFWFLGLSTVDNCLTKAGLERVESYYFPYYRPISGLRRRAIWAFRVL